MLRKPRWLLFAVIVVVLALVGLAGVSVATVRRPFPQTDGEISLPGLTASVEVLRDRWGVAHLYADSAEDLFQAQGFVHAQDRFFEMDIRRHITAGRLSELFGASQLETDTYIRTLGWRHVAEVELPLLSASTRRYLDAYADGVNSYLQAHSPADLSLEYSLLGLQGLTYTPEPWTSVDSLSWLKAMAWDLGSNLDREVETSLLLAKVGPDLTADLWPGYPLTDEFDPIVGSGAVSDGAFDPDADVGDRRVLPKGLARADGIAYQNVLRSVARLTNNLPTMVADRSVDGATGSNSWVVSGDRTTTGKPVLANDPHLATSIPSTFSQVGLHCRTVSKACPFEVTGYSFAGMPGVVIGRNATIAWGLTTSNVDVQDLYLEQVRGDTVRVGDRYQPLTARTEELRVAGEDAPRTITVRSSRHGPLLSDASAQLQQVGAASAGEGNDAYAVSLAWTALQPSRTMDALMRINTARDFTQFRAAAKLLGAPSQNLVYADTEGNIGYQLPGAIPDRGRGDGDTVSPGWDPDFDWKGLIPFDELPWTENPSAGFIVSANNQIIGKDYRRHLGSTYSYGWRSQEIVDALKANPRISVTQNLALQSDSTVRFADVLVPRLLKLKIADSPTTPASWIAEGQQTLVGWDYSATTDSAAAAYFFVVVHDILERTFRDQMPSELWPSGGDRWNAVLTELMKDPDNGWWDDVNTPGVVEKRDDILRAAMVDARRELTSLISRDTDGWQWGKLHRVTLTHQTLGSSGIGLLERIFNRGDWSVGGGPAVVNAMAFDDTRGYGVVAGPTMRMVVDLDDPDASQWINQSGTSGHAFHPNYDDQAPLWVRGDTVRFVSSRAAVDGLVEHQLTLTPTG
ncbi:MAG TPA: penicillin acylase family protein [Microlunatus sp.]|nr:penicillin acylase family protein [Microlunatus sp.]